MVARWAFQDAASVGRDDLGAPLAAISPEAAE